MMFNDIQTFLAEAGEAGCYALCLINVAEEFTGNSVNIVEALKSGIDKGCISYNWNDKNDNDNFYVNNPATFLYYLTGKHWTVEHVSADYVKKNEKQFLIERWERVKTGTTIGHFQRENFEPITDSLTVKYGTIKSKRLCTVTN